MFETAKQRIDALKAGWSMKAIEQYYIDTNYIILIGVKWSDCGKEKNIAW